MPRIFAALLAALGLGASSTTSTDAQGPAGELRSMALQLTPDQIGLSPANFPHEVWGIVMETGMGSGFYTLVVFGDGTTSLYFSSGGGVIGAGEEPTVRAASSEFIAMANSVHAKATPTDSYPPPSDGQTRFHFLTFDGTRSYSAREQDLGEGRDELSNLFHSAHAVIAAVRNAQQ